MPSLSSFLSSFSSAVMAFAFSFMYHAVCEFLFSHSSTPLVAFLYFMSMTFLGLLTLIPEILVEYYLPVLPYLAVNYLLGDLDEALEDLFFVPEPAPPPPPAPPPSPPPVYIDPSVKLRMARLAVHIEKMFDVSPPPPVKLEATDILPAWYPASFPLPPTPPPRPIRNRPYRTIKLGCIP